MPENVRDRDALDLRLARRYRTNGDLEARDRLVLRCQPLLRRLVRPYLNRGHASDDLMQVANLGLVKAIDRFDPTRARRLVTFVAPTVTGEVKRHFRDHSWVAHVPRSVQEDHARVVSTADDTTGREPGDVRRRAERAGLSKERVDEVAAADQCFSALALDQPFADSDAPVQDAFGAIDPGFEQAEHRATMETAFTDGGLTPQDRRIVELRFFDDLHQREIAADIGVSQMQVSRRLKAIHETLEAQGRRWLVESGGAAA